MSNETEHKTLQRGVGVGGATLLGLGSILGTGVYFGIPALTAEAGTSLILPIVVAALLATCNALSSAQLAACYPVSGGTYEYGYQLLNPWAGFAAGWMFLCAKSASAATAALQVTAYLLPRPAPLAACAVAVVITLMVLSGLRRSTWVNTILVSVTVVGLIVFAGATLQSTVSDGVSANVQQSTSLDLRSFMEMAALMFVGFTGYGRVATLGEEIRDPRRNIPIAVVATLAVSALLYVLVAAAVNSQLTVGRTALTLTELTGDSAGWMTSTVKFGAIAAMSGVLLNLILGLSRVVLAMARRNDLPVLFAKLNASQTTPVPAVFLVAVVIVALISMRDPQATWSLSAVTVLIYYSLTNLSALKLPPENRMYPRWISMLGLGGCLLLAAHVNPESIVFGAAILAVGLIGRALLR